jgi:serine/tyrosine/threonine adenylyltransferase
MARHARKPHIRPMPVSAAYRPDPRWLSLGEGFSDVVAPAAFPKHVLRWRDDRMAATIGLDTLDDAEWIAHLARFEALPGNLPAPHALRYNGHQFQVWNPDLGDGRGFLHAQIREQGSGRLLDLGTKGSGQTPWSRRGDGRLTLKGAVRELLATQLLEARGVDTSKTLSIVETGEELWRGDEPSPTRSAVLVRLSHGHVRIGTFQRLAYLRDLEGIGRVVDYVVETHMPDLASLAGADLTLAMFGRVVERVAATCARWMAAGFVHGVLNSDNINVTGESFDYGPWRFLPTYEPGFTAAYFDETGLYAFGRQPHAVSWNLARLAECLLEHAPRDGLVALLGTFSEHFNAATREAMFARLGLVTSEDQDADLELVKAFFAGLHATQCGFERAFHDWWGGPASMERAMASDAAAAYRAEGFDAFRNLIVHATPLDPRRLAEPHFAGEPVDMLVDRVEALWAPIAERDDWAPLYNAVAEIGAARAVFRISGRP